jgi:hypothetical protein
MDETDLTFNAESSPAEQTPRAGHSAIDMTSGEIAMPAKRPTPIDPEQLVDNIHDAIRAYIEAGKGKVLSIGPMELVPRKGMEFDIVVRCIGTRPQWE